MSFLRFPRLHYVFNNIRYNNNNNIIVSRCITIYYIFILYAPYTRPVQFPRRRLHRQMRSGLVWRVLGSPASRLPCRVILLRWLSIAYSIRVRRAHEITIITIVYTHSMCVFKSRKKKVPTASKTSQWLPSHYYIMIILNQSLSDGSLYPLHNICKRRSFVKLRSAVQADNLRNNRVRLDASDCAAGHAKYEIYFFVIECCLCRRRVVSLRWHFLLKVSLNLRIFFRLSTMYHKLALLVMISKYDRFAAAGRGYEKSSISCRWNR